MSRHKRHTAQLCVTNLRVLIDMDQVLADFEGHLLTKYREAFPDDPFIPLAERRGFYARDQYAKLRHDLPDKVRSIYNTPGFFLNLPEIEGAVKAVQDMSQIENVDVFICTSPIQKYDDCVREKYQWVENHLGVQWTDKLILTKDKTIVNGHILIDDRPRIKGCCTKPSWEHIVFTTDHNQNENLRGKRRLNNWTDAQWVDLIEDFKKRI